MIVGNFLYHKAAGRQFLSDASPPLDPDCTLSLASAARFFTNVAALQLVERGLVGLDDAIKTHIPEIQQCLVIEKGAHGAIVARPPSRDITLRHILTNTSGIGMGDYEEFFGKDAADSIPPLDFPENTHYLARHCTSHLLFEPGQGFYYGWCIYMVQLLVERLGGEATYVAYADKHLFGALGMASSTYKPATTPHVWERRLQVVGREGGGDDGAPETLIVRNDITYGITCSVSDLATFFGDLMSPDSKLLGDPALRDLLFTPQLAPGSPAHTMFLSEASNYGFVMPLVEGVPYQESWTLASSPSSNNINWTVAGALFEADDVLPGTGLPAGTVTFEGLPNVIWTMNREKGRMMLFGNQLMPSYDVCAHNLAAHFIRDAWRTFA